MPDRPRTRPRRRWPVAAVTVDTLMLAAAIAAASLVPLLGSGDSPLAWTVGFPALVLVLFALRRTYASRIQLRLLNDLGDVVAATGMAAVAVLSLRALAGADLQTGASHVVHYWAFATVFLALGHTGLFRAQIRARRCGEAVRPTLVIGAGRTGRQAAAQLLAEPELGLRPIGFLDKEPLRTAEEATELPVLGASWDLERVVSEHGVEHALVAFSTAPHHVFLALVRRCWELGVSVSLVPRLFEIDCVPSGVDHLGALPLVAVQATDPNGPKLGLRPVLDRAAAAVTLLLALPLLAVAAVAAKLSSRGPVLRRQPRMGRDGRQFDLLSFRTAEAAHENGHPDVDHALGQLARNGTVSNGSTNGDRNFNGAADGNGSGALATGNGRRTPIGRALHRSSLDRLPRLWNVLRGDMPLMGSPPERTNGTGRFDRTEPRSGDRHLR